MLKIFRQHTKIIIWLVVAALVLLFGAGSIVDLVNRKKSDRFAGEAFGKTVTFQEYNQFYRATELFMPSDKPIDDPEILRNYTWQNIVYSLEAKRTGIKISDAEVRSEIANILKQQGLINPTPEQYKVWLTRALQLSPRKFEEGLREFMRIQKLLRLKIASFIPAGADKLTDPKAKEDAAEKQKTAFIAWTNDVNNRAALRDYLTPSPYQEETPEATPAVAPTVPQVPAAAAKPAAPVKKK